MLMLISFYAFKISIRVFVCELVHIILFVNL